ncbi:adenylate kinase [Rhizobium leguminosarum]|uniref:adenylate kinase n=1 Tax=Rhizobium leguminosarum TaxID=384 RepID=UPI00098FE4AC|nr:adenylate kinase [Rhizobium leguminosarum]ASS58073.1 adenylate kinase [Rhizobium leguminosarum bv. viciae]MBY5488415.1 adenylate kinase [Rhizobium leguminosarum]MDX6006488.1 adenylate kinase [Rhizobium leguminosarum]NKK15603.1 adenylate kinase [Rhizobium leguminosarum bv. viciae]NKK31026.1 adenylate kinase [Rhizobium leguminosarum bv. viciae]
MTRLVFIGPPGAGKGTQAERLIRERGLLHISTGDLLRDAIKAQSALGVQAKAAVDSGGLVPDEVVIGLVEEGLEIAAGRAGYILDGFPRTVAQASALEAYLAEKNLPLDHVILFDIPLELLEARIKTRAERLREAEGSSRSDDNADVLRRRVGEFIRATVQLGPFYEQRRLLRRIDARQDVEAVAAAIASTIGA